MPAINATDASGASAICRRSASAGLLTRRGLGTVYQISCRDRNRIAIQGDSQARRDGRANVLCLTGDDVGAGDQRGEAGVRPRQRDTIHTIRTMRDEGVFLSGHKITKPPHLFGAAESLRRPGPNGVPNDSPRRSRPAPSSSNYIFVARFEAFMTRVTSRARQEGLHHLAGIGPLPPAGAPALDAVENVPGASTSPMP
ncbi:MAG: hypothetical protein R3D59_09250 [Paracoccaceae bacterium]